MISPLVLFGIGRYYTIFLPLSTILLESWIWCLLHRITKAIDKNTVKFMFVLRAFYSHSFLWLCYCKDCDLRGQNECEEKVTSCNDEEVRGAAAQKEYWSQALASLQFTFMPVDVTIVQVFISAIFQRTRQLSMICWESLGSFSEKYQLWNCRVRTSQHLQEIYSTIDVKPTAPREFDKVFTKMEPKRMSWPTASLL